MKTEPSGRSRSQGGFSLVEMLIVVAIVMIMAAVALPNIGQYLRTYKIRGASQVVDRRPAGGAEQGDHVQHERRGLVRGGRRGQLPHRAGGSAGPARPTSSWVPSRTCRPASSSRRPGRRQLGTSVRFNRLGGFCNPADAGCATAATPVCVGAEVANRCSYDATGLSTSSRSPRRRGGRGHACGRRTPTCARACASPLVGGCSRTRDGRHHEAPGPGPLRTMPRPASRWSRPSSPSSFSSSASWR